MAINGMGRIGRMAFRHLLLEPGLAVVAVNDLADGRTLAHLLNHDSIHGPAPDRVTCQGGALAVAGQHIRAFSEPDPGRLPLGQAGAEVVLECTGRFNTRALASGHLHHGIRQVILAAPCPEADRILIPGVNAGALDPAADRILAAPNGASQCLALLVKVLDDAFGLDRGFMTSIHSYTNEQRILDLPHPDLRLARAASQSMIPTLTEDARTVGLVLPHLRGRLDGLMVRVPTADVSLVDLTAWLSREAGLEEVHAAFRTAAAGPLAPWLTVLEEELVSSDLIGNPASAAYDPFLTHRLGPRLVKVFGWHDNEWAYAARLAEICRLLADGSRP